MLRSLTLSLTLACLCLSAKAEDTARVSPVKAGAAPQRIALNYELCDGPGWTGTFLYLPDVKARVLFQLDPATSTQKKIAEELRCSATCFRNGRLYLSDNGNAKICVLDGEAIKTLAVVDAAEKPVNRPNDLDVDAAGGVYVTLTKPNQVVYCTAAGEVTVAVQGLESPNGLVLSPDEKTLYVASYIPKEIWAYDVVKSGVVTNGRKFAAMDDGKDPGADGMTVDSIGNVYCAGAKSVWIWNPQGALLGKIDTPARPINCEFGGSDMKTLYITCFDGLYAQAMNVAGPKRF